MKYINPKYQDSAEISRLAEEFKNSKPYKHIIMDDFMVADFANSLYERFPSYEKLNKAYKGYNEFKAEGADFPNYDENFTKLKETLISKDFSLFLEKVTGIKDVFMTNDNLGAGLHQGLSGSFLDIHIDFNIHPKLNVHRRLNLLIYLHKDWKPEYNGSLELWNSDMTVCEKMVSPEFNRCVIFETNEISYHGYTKKTNLPEGITRKSFYGYYYTNEREDAAPYHDTFFRATPEDSTLKKVTTTAKENFKNTIKATLKKIGITL